MDVAFKRKLIPLKMENEADSVSSWKANWVALEAS